jgi:hypothetical protein
MTEHVVIGVRTALAPDATHRHISELCTPGPIRYTRQEVIDSIRAGENWQTLVHASGAEIHIVKECPHEGCSLSPYIATDLKGTKESLEDLGPC